MNRQEIADGLAAYARTVAHERKLLPGDVLLIDSLATALAMRWPSESKGLKPSPAGINLMHEFEGYRPTTYRDPGSSNGKPYTGGWGTTTDENGDPLPLGVTWPRERWEGLFQRDLEKFAAKVGALLDGAPTTQGQFDAMVSLAYNIGVGAFEGSTVLRKHKAGDYAGAAAAFGMWVKNDGKTMPGLVRRRAAEAKLYRGET